MSSKKSDIQLIQEILEGSKIAFELLYNKYKRLYMSICCRYFTSREDAEDALQEAIIKIHTKLSTYDQCKASFVTWSKKVVINTCLEKLRKPNLLRLFGDLFEFGNNLPIPSIAEENLNLEDLTKIIQSLPKGYRTVFNLYVIDGYNHVEIAEILKISVSTSKTQLMKAKKLLKSKIGTDEVIFEYKYA